MSLLGDLTGRRSTTNEADAANPPGRYDPVVQLWQYPGDESPLSENPLIECPPDGPSRTVRDFHRWLAGTQALTYCPTTMGGRDGDKDDETA